MKKSILFVIDSLESGGAEKSLVTYLNTLDYSQFNVDLLLFRQKGLFLPLVPKQVHMIETLDYYRATEKPLGKFLIEALKNRQFRYIYSRIGTSISLRDPFIKNKFNSAQIIWKYIRRSIDKLPKEYDTAIAFSQGVPTYFVAEKVNAKNKLSWINTDYKVAGFNSRYDLEYYKKMNSIVAISEKCKEAFVSSLPEIEQNTEVIYDVVSPALLEKMAHEGEGFDDSFNGLRILSIGRLVYSKGYDMSIEACLRLKETGVKFRWYVLGEGVLKEELEKMISLNNLEEHFILLGAKSNPYPFILQSDLYVHASRLEGFGLAIQEARIFEKPIVSTNFTVVNDQISSEENGLIVEMNADAIYEGIMKMIKDESLRDHILSNLSQEDAGTEKEIDKVYALM